MQPAARLGDLHECADDGDYPQADLKLKEGSSNILINGKSAVRVGDKLTCKVDQEPAVAEGSSTVLFNGKPAARFGDAIEKGGSINQGSSNVLIGDSGTKIKFGNGAKIKLGDNCQIKLSCSSGGFPQSLSSSTLATTSAASTPATAIATTEPTLKQELTSFGLDMTPGVGSLKSATQLITGTDLVTGEPVDRKMEAAGIVLGVAPGGKALLKCKKGAKLAKKIIKEIKISEKQAQKKFKHAKEFGVDGNYSKENATAFQNAIDSHVNDPNTIMINGTYRGDSVTHFYNPNTGLNAIVSNEGDFISGWKLTDYQASHIINSGKLGGG